MTDAMIISKKVFWLVGQLLGLSVTTVGGIMVNSYVSNEYFMSYHHPGFSYLFCDLRYDTILYFLV